MTKWNTWQEWDYNEILRKRIWIANNAPNNPTLQSILIELCRRDSLFFFTFFSWTLSDGNDVPFILHPFQKTLVRWIEDRIDQNEVGVVEKSRQIGCSWVFMTFIFYKWLFEKNFFSIVGSRKAEIVDSRDSQTTLFYKCDYQIRKLPKWLLPPRFNPDKDRRQMILVNPKSNNIILGESANANFARGATANFVYFDEFAFWDFAQSSWTSASRSAKCRIAVSTPAPNSYFKAVRFSKEMKSNNRVKTIHWSSMYDQAWYEKQKEIMSEEMVAQELDLSYSQTGQGRVYEEIDLCDFGKYEYNPQWPLYTSSDWGLKDPTAIIWAQKDLKNKKFYIIDSYQNEGKTVEFYLPFFTGIIKADNSYKYEYTPEEKKIIARHRQWKRPVNFGDPASKARNQVTDTSVMRELNKSGVHIHTNDKANHFAPRREATKRLLRQLAIDERQLMFIESIRQSAYPKRQDKSQATKAITKPVHNLYSHYRSALEYMAVNVSLDTTPPKVINYLKKRRDKDEDDDYDYNGRPIEKRKRKVIRYGFK